MFVARSTPSVLQWIPRAVKRAGCGGAPSTPGRLGYMAAKGERDWSICPSKTNFIIV
jgi:hypothetical protein